MANVLLVILLIISIILIGLILIQRSEGGALGIGGSGGGGGGGGLMSGRGTADLVSRMTAVFGAAFLVVSLLITVSFNFQNQDSGPFNAERAQEEMATGIVGGENIQNNDLNAPVVSDKDTTPLVEDSQDEESTANPQKKTEETPQD
ncbi:MAG: preprotein translocase subunit SecG [Robiginitomaculum sp.]|nr:preprotein translocase subunit SecG [Robiginitomaculum sp.]